MSKHITNDTTLIANVIGNVTGNVIGNVTGNVTGNLTGNVTGNVVGDVTGDLTGNANTATNATYAAIAGNATTAAGLDYVTTTPSTPVFTWTSGTTTVGGATFTRSTVIPLDATYGINFVSMYVELTATSSPVAPYTIKINSNNAAETTGVGIMLYTTTGPSSRPQRGTLTSGGDTISIPNTAGITVTTAVTFNANFHYKCVL